MATIIGYEGGLWLVAILLMLAVGLAWALVKATTSDRGPAQVRERRPR